MNMWEFFHEHWFLAFLCICSLYYGFKLLITLPIRHLNIRSSGWPPAHLDADGDYKQKGEDA